MDGRPTRIVALLGLAVDDFLSTAESDLKRVQADPSLFAAGDTDPFANTNRSASALGLDECGSSG